MRRGVRERAQKKKKNPTLHSKSGHWTPASRRATSSCQGIAALAWGWGARQGGWVRERRSLRQAAANFGSLPPPQAPAWPPRFSKRSWATAHTEKSLSVRTPAPAGRCYVVRVRKKPGPQTSAAPWLPDPSALTETAAGGRWPHPSARLQPTNPRPLEAGPEPRSPAPKSRLLIKAATHAQQQTAAAPAGGR